EMLGVQLEKYQAEQMESLECLAVKYPKEIEEHKPTHPVGEFLLVFNSAQYGKPLATNTVIQDEDVYISLFTVVRNLDQGKFAEEYTDLAKAGLSGLQINQKRADKLVYPVSVKWLKEENQYTWYETIFFCPSVNIQQITVQ